MLNQKQHIWAHGVAGDRATAWCVLYYSDTTPNRILYNFIGEKVNKKLARTLSRKKFKVIAEGDELPRVEYLAKYIDYADAEYVYRYMIYEKPAWYGIKIFKKKDYDLASRNGKL